MTRSQTLLASLIAAGLLTACGGGGAKDLSGGGSDGGGGTTDTSTPVLTISTFACTDAANSVGCTSTLQLPAEKASKIRVNLVDGKGKNLSEQIVVLTTTLGSISSPQKMTDSLGMVEFELNAPAPNTDQAGTITASYTPSGSSSKPATQNKNFTFVPGQASSDNYQLSLKLMACTDIADVSTCTETQQLPSERPSLAEVQLLSPKGEPVPGVIINAATSKGMINPSSSLLTKTDGKISFLLSSEAGASQTAGTFTVTTTAPTGSLLTQSKNFEFGASNLAMTLETDTNSLPAGNVAVLTAKLTLNGSPYTSPVPVTFSSTCVTNQQATIDSPVTSQQGIASATYKASGTKGACRDKDTITATAAGMNPVQVVITNQSVPVQSISANKPIPEFIYVRGTGKNETATISFTLKDAQNQPVAGKKLNFAFATLTQNNSNFVDYSLAPEQATTDQNGQATVTVNAGAFPVPVRVVATLDDNANIHTASQQIGVGIGLPDDDSFSFSADKYNIEGWDYDGIEAKITVRLADRFNNPVVDGTKVYFTTEGGSISGSLAGDDSDVTGTCTSVAGVCTATLASQDPRPIDGRVTVSAYVEGEESFLDYNGNGIFDKADLTGVPDDKYSWEVPNYVRSYTDIGDPFMDVNVDDTAKTPPTADVDGYRLNIDKLLVDANGNGKRDLGDAQYTGLMCSDDTVKRGFCNKTLALLFRNKEFIFTGTGNGAILPIQVLDDKRYDETTGFVVAGTNTWRSDIAVDLRAGSRIIRFLPAHLPKDGSMNPIPETIAGNLGDLTYDLRGANPIPAGSTTAITTTNGGAIEAYGDQTLGCNWGYNSPYPSTTRPQFMCAVISPEDKPNGKSEGNMKISVTSPKGVSLTSSVKVIDAG